MFIELYDNNANRIGDSVENINIKYSGPGIDDDIRDGYYVISENINRILAGGNLINHSMMIEYIPQEKKDTITISSENKNKKYIFKYDKLDDDNGKTISGEIILDKDNNVISFIRGEYNNKSYQEYYGPGGAGHPHNYEYKYINPINNYAWADKSTAIPPNYLFHNTQCMGNNDSVIGSISSAGK